MVLVPSGPHPQVPIPRLLSLGSPHPGAHLWVPTSRVPFPRSPFSGDPSPWVPRSHGCHPQGPHLQGPLVTLSPRSPSLAAASPRVPTSRSPWPVSPLPLVPPTQCHQCHPQCPQLLTCGELQRQVGGQESQARRCCHGVQGRGPSVAPCSQHRAWGRKDWGGTPSSVSHLVPAAHRSPSPSPPVGHLPLGPHAQVPISVPILWDPPLGPPPLGPLPLMSPGPGPRS